MANSTAAAKKSYDMGLQQQVKVNNSSDANTENRLSNSHEV